MEINSCVLALASDLLLSSGTEIVLGLFTLLSTCGWFVSGRKHRQEIQSLKADNRIKDMQLAQIYVEQFEKNIAEPLRREVRELRDEIKELKNALERGKECIHRDNCPIVERVRNKQAGDED